MRKGNKKNKGFSLVELIIVIAIMAILAGIIAPQYFKHVKNSQVSADISSAEAARTAISAEISAEAAGSSKLTIMPTTASATWLLISGDAETVTGTIGKSKVDNDFAFYYNISLNGDVKVGVGKSASAVTELTPTRTTDADSPWK